MVESFRKYEFPDYETFAELKESLLTDTHNSIVELGILRDPMYSVDILWVENIPLIFEQYEIWDIIEDGSHTFEGLHFIEPSINQL
jgi:hypothetical protein